MPIRDAERKSRRDPRPARCALCGAVRWTHLFLGRLRAPDLEENPPDAFIGSIVPPGLKRVPSGHTTSRGNQQRGLSAVWWRANSPSWLALLMNRVVRIDCVRIDFIRLFCLAFPNLPRYIRALMFEVIEEQLAAKAEKLVHLRRFL